MPALLTRRDKAHQRHDPEGYGKQNCRRLPAVQPHPRQQHGNHGGYGGKMRARKGQDMGHAGLLKESLLVLVHALPVAKEHGPCQRVLRARTKRLPPVFHAGHERHAARLQLQIFPVSRREQQVAAAVIPGKPRLVGGGRGKGKRWSPGSGRRPASGSPPWSAPGTGASVDASSRRPPSRCQAGQPPFENAPRSARPDTTSL